MSEILQREDDDRDAHVVHEICGYITSNPPQSFFLFAGAGSGKTRTLVEVLRRVTGVISSESGGKYADQLRSRGRSIRVITYTKNAANVVSGRLGDNDLTAVSTIHAFCWELIQGFDDDIKCACLALKDQELCKAKQAAQAKKNGETDTDRKKYADINAEKSLIVGVDRFIYHPDRNTYGPGALAHSTVLSVAAWLIRNRPTLRRILEERHPLLLIDESQDTMRDVLDALLYIESERRGNFTLGLIGDHRQRIYQDGHRDLPGHVPKNWKFPVLRMNHRSQRRVVELINSIWDSEIDGRTQPKTGFAQHSQVAKSAGVVRIFIGDAGLETSQKISLEGKCAVAMVTATGADAWSSDAREFHTLALEHKLAAKRGGFANVYLAMDLLDEDAAAPKGNGERSGPSMVRPLLGPVLDLASCFDEAGELREFEAMNVLRDAGALSHLVGDVEARRERLASLYDAVVAFGKITRMPNATVRDALQPLLAVDVFDAHARLISEFSDTSPPPAPPKIASKEDREVRLRRGWCHLFCSPWEQVARYRAYLCGEADLATHQVVKGSEFPHVMVVMDDREAGGFLFSYDKLFGAEPLSKGDAENIAVGKETAVDRTLRLLYVTCSRAEESLALVLWANDPAAAAETVKALGWFLPEEISVLN